MKTRNHNATCGNCPYWRQNPKSICGVCRLNPDVVEKLETEWCSHHPDFWEAEAAMLSITYADGHTEDVASTADCKPPTLDDVLAAYRRAADMAGMYSGRICDACAHPHTVACGRCLVGWKLQFQPKEDAQ